MKDKISGFRIILSWICFATGFSIYESYGIFASLIPFVMAAYIREDRDKLLWKKFISVNYWKLSAVIYYLLLGGTVLLFNVKLYVFPTLVFVALIGFPIILFMIVCDLIDICKTNGKKD